MSLKGGYRRVVAVPSARSVCLYFLNFVCSYLSSVCLGPTEGGMWRKAPTPRPDATVAMEAPTDWGGLNLTGAWPGGRGLGGAAALELLSLAVAANGFGRLLGGWLWWP